MQEAVRALAALLLQETRTKDLDLLVNDIDRELLLQNKYLTATVQSARPLNQQNEELCSALLKKITGATTVVLNKQLNPSVKGGVILTTPTVIIDLTLKNKLRQLEA